MIDYFRRLHCVKQPDGGFCNLRSPFAIAYSRDESGETEPPAGTIGFALYLIMDEIIARNFVLTGEHFKRIHRTGHRADIRVDDRQIQT